MENLGLQRALINGSIQRCPADGIDAVETSALGGIPILAEGNVHAIGSQ